MYDPDLPSNRMIFEIRRDPVLCHSFPERLEEIMSRYGLRENEKAAFRKVDVRTLRDLGLHPYFLPQVTRLLRGSANNDSQSEAAQAYRRSMIDSNDV